MSIKRMMLWGAVALVAAALLAAAVVWYYINSTPDTFAAKYQAHCASCHGGNLQGSGIGPALVGELSDYIQGTPRVHDSGIELGELEYGYGWMLDVAVHPDYAENGWIYLHYGDLCEDCGTLGAASMNKVVRGRMESGQWLDEEVIWEVPESLYAGFTDLAAGGRLAFDGNGFLYLSICCWSIPPAARLSGWCRQVRSNRQICKHHMRKT